MLSHELIAQYGALAVFLNVLGASLGLPLPVMPTLVAVGAGSAAAAHDLSSVLPQYALMLGAAIGGGLLGDLVWFQGGRRYGGRTLHAVCTLSPSRDRCISKTEGFFERWGVRLLFVARFVPGLALVAVPLCGAMAVRLRTFIWHDCAGVALWASAGLVVGAAFAAQIKAMVRLASRLGWPALAISAAAVAACVLYRYCRRTVLAKAREQAVIVAGQPAGGQ
ncbi:DedA family protein [Achromobacter agilis]|uniref:Putative membrane protein n=1 Tax=Achromobacter agilis TaxID=1353888 RepID=A0A446CIT2_9BURK|nr:VTT domain-containing protein [Achromobacter agilis]SSW67779.1 putative membrane protein [Achromobacter agilis]